jgi:hypothetical protein
MNYLRIILLIFLMMVSLVHIQAHVFTLYSNTNEEMKDSIIIDLSCTELRISFTSIFTGQIAPHIRFMADTNGDTLLTGTEIAAFFSEYKHGLLENISGYIIIDEKPAVINMVDIRAPLIMKDNFTDELHVNITIFVHEFTLEHGKHHLTIDTRLFFQIGSEFIEMAKEKAQFTGQQENEIARYMQIKMNAAKRIEFESAYPGYIAGNKKSIYGIFYDHNAIRIQFLPYAQLRTQFFVR